MLALFSLSNVISQTKILPSKLTTKMHQHPRGKLLSASWLSVWRSLKWRGENIDNFCLRYVSNLIWKPIVTMQARSILFSNSFDLQIGWLHAVSVANWLSSHCLDPQWWNDFGTTLWTAKSLFIYHPYMNPTVPDKNTSLSHVLLCQIIIVCL